MKNEVQIYIVESQKSLNRSREPNEILKDFKKSKVYVSIMYRLHDLWIGSFRERGEGLWAIG